MKEFIVSKSFIFLLLIVIFAGILRFYKIGSNPPSLTWDETAWGYNAYSIGMDGKDEFGRFLPITYLESFGDYKPPVYVYLDVIPVKFFGLNEFSTRFPSALFGTLTVFLTYFLVKRIFRGKTEDSNNQIENLALVASFILAISPWHIMLSRAAFEANVATFFLAAGIWAFLASIQDRRWYLIISAVSFVLSMYTFNTSRVFAPMIVVILALVFWKRLIKTKKEAIISAIIGFILFIPLFFFLLTPQAKTRFNEVNIFTNPDIVKTANQEIANDKGAIWSKVIHNRRVLFGIEYMVHYFDNLSPLFLFTRGDGNPKFSVQSVGQMYIWEVIFFAGGAFFLFRKREGAWWIIPVWFLLGIIPAATARETPHALRIETTLPTFQILTAYGLVSLFAVISNFKQKILTFQFKHLIFGVIALFAIFNLAYFIHEYYDQYPYEYSAEWQYGYKDSIEYVKSVQQNYDYINITSNLGRPYIYYLFYTKTAPQDFRESAKISRDTFGFVTVKSFDKYRFPDRFDYGNDNGKRVLYIGTIYDVPKQAKVLKTFRLLDGSPILVAYE